MQLKYIAGVCIAIALSATMNTDAYAGRGCKSGKCYRPGHVTHGRYGGPGRRYAKPGNHKCREFGWHRHASTYWHSH